MISRADWREWCDEQTVGGWCDEQTGEDGVMSRLTRMEHYCEQTTGMVWW